MLFATSCRSGREIQNLRRIKRNLTFDAAETQRSISQENGATCLTQPPSTPLQNKGDYVNWLYGTDPCTGELTQIQQFTMGRILVLGEKLKFCIQEHNQLRLSISQFYMKKHGGCNFWVSFIPHSTVWSKTMSSLRSLMYRDSPKCLGLVDQHLVKIKAAADVWMVATIAYQWENSVMLTVLRAVSSMRWIKSFPLP